MASIRKLKKEVNFIAYELLTDAFAYKHFHPELEEKMFDEVIKKIVKGRNDLINRINNPDELNNKENLSQYYNKVKHDMLSLSKVLENLN
jgi:hypothetical protein